MPPPMTLVYSPSLSDKSYHFALQSLLRKVGGLEALGDPHVAGQLHDVLDYHALAARGHDGRIPIKP
jgi:hypothetical protein